MMFAGGTPASLVKGQRHADVLGLIGLLALAQPGVHYET